MPHFLLDYRYVDPDARARVRPDHLAYLAQLHEQGSVLLAGPVGDGSGAVVVFEAEDLAEVERLVAADPYTREGVSADRRIRPWTLVVGREAPRAGGRPT